MPNRHPGGHEPSPEHRESDHHQTFWLSDDRDRLRSWQAGASVQSAEARVNLAAAE
jgi:hypothetical protein